MQACSSSLARTSNACSTSYGPPSRRARTSKWLSPRSVAVADRATEVKTLPQLAYRLQYEVPGVGTIAIAALQAEQVPETAVLLAETFAEAKGYGAYKRFLERQILEYLDMRTRPEMGFMAEGRCVVLVANLYLDPSHTTGSDRASGDPGAAAALREQLQRPLVIGAAEVSWDPRTRSSQPLLDPPLDCAYLSNTAVDYNFRQLGVGFNLVQAAEDVAVLHGERELFLHLRFKDKPATKLYAKSGFKPRLSHPPMVMEMAGLDRMYLMAKKLTMD